MNGILLLACFFSLAGSVLFFLLLGEVSHQKCRVFWITAASLLNTTVYAAGHFGLWGGKNVFVSGLVLMVCSVLLFHQKQIIRFVLSAALFWIAAEQLVYFTILASAGRIWINLNTGILRNWELSAQCLTGFLFILLWLWVLLWLRTKWKSKICSEIAKSFSGFDLIWLAFNVILESLLLRQESSMIWSSSFVSFLIVCVWSVLVSCLICIYKIQAAHYQMENQKIHMTLQFEREKAGLKKQVREDLRQVSHDALHLCSAIQVNLESGNATLAAEELETMAGQFARLLTKESSCDLSPSLLLNQSVQKWKELKIPYEIQLYSDRMNQNPVLSSQILDLLTKCIPDVQDDQDIQDICSGPQISNINQPQSVSIKSRNLNEGWICKVSWNQAARADKPAERKHAQIQNLKALCRQEGLLMELNAHDEICQISVCCRMQ